MQTISRPLAMHPEFSSNNAIDLGFQVCPAQGMRECSCHHTTRTMNVCNSCPGDLAHHSIGFCLPPVNGGAPFSAPSQPCHKNS